MEKSNKQLVQTLCINAVMIALFFALDMLSVKIGNNAKITFSGLPIILSAVFFGPLVGATVGGLGSLLSQLYGFGIGVTTVLWIVPAIVRGLVVGFLYRRFGKKFLGVNIILSSVIVSALNTLVSFVDSHIFKYYNPVTFLTAIAPRFLMGILTAVAYCIVIYPLLTPVDKVLKKIR